MQVTIRRMDDDVIATMKDYQDAKKGEVAHFLMELEIVKQELLLMWNQWDKNGTR